MSDLLCSAESRWTTFTLNDQLNTASWFNGDGDGDMWRDTWREKERDRKRERETGREEALNSAIQRWGSHRSTLRLFDGSHTSLTWTNRADIYDELTLPHTLNEMRKWSVNQSLRCCGIHYWSDLTAHWQIDILLANQSCLKNENESKVEKRKILNQPNRKRKLNERSLTASMNR